MSKQPNKDVSNGKNIQRQYSIQYCLNIIVIPSLNSSDDLKVSGVWGRIWVKGLGRKLIVKNLSYSEER